METVLQLGQLQSGNALAESACSGAPVDVPFDSVTSAGEHERKIVPARRFQKGCLVVRSDRRYGVLREDVLTLDGTFTRKVRWIPLGLLMQQSERNSWRQFQPYLDRVSEAAKKCPVRSGMTLSEFVEEWRQNVSV